MPESVNWHELLRVWLHDPVDKALDIRGHEARAARYASRALGWDVTSREIKSSASLGDQLAAIAETIPMPTAGYYPGRPGKKRKMKVRKVDAQGKITQVAP